jgi:hypothetical protein
LGYFLERVIGFEPTTLCLAIVGEAFTPWQTVPLGGELPEVLRGIFFDQLISHRLLNVMRCDRVSTQKSPQSEESLGGDVTCVDKHLPVPRFADSFVAGATTESANRHCAAGIPFRR